MLLCIKAKSANSTDAHAWALVLSSSPNPCQHGPAAGLDFYARFKPRTEAEPDTRLPCDTLDGGMDIYVEN